MRTIHRPAFYFLLPCLCALIAAPSAWAGGPFEVYAYAGPGPFPGTGGLELVPARWDDRCLPIPFTLNTFMLPNSDPPLDAATTAAILEQALDVWNDIPTSYIEMHLVGESQRPPGTSHRLDLINELSFFLGDGSFVAAAEIDALLFDREAIPGLDIDGDGDADVFDPAPGLERCVDIDGDGDFELPAGFYPAGTILDVDIYFDNSWLWTTGSPDASFGTVDLEGVAVHELGHALGLSHSLINQVTTDNGVGVVMAVEFDRDDPVSKLAMRDLKSDDVAWASFLYPEGSASSGLAALQADDIAFDQVYGIIRGEVTHGRTGWPLVGASIQAVDRDSGEVVASHYTGHARIAIDLTTWQEILDPRLPSFHLASGSYTLPVPAGEYHLAVEAMDGSPWPAAEFARDSSAEIGDFFGLQDFNEEFLLKSEDSDSDSGSDSDSDSGSDSELELLEVEVEVGEVVEVNHTTGVDLNLDPFDLVGSEPGRDIDFLGNVPAGSIVAVRIPAAEMAEFLLAGAPWALAFRTGVEDRSQVPVFPQAALATGRVEGAGASLDLEDPLLKATSFVGQDDDFAPLFVPEPADLAEDLWEAIDEDGVDDFFLVLEIPEAGGGASGLPPGVGVDIGQEAGVLDRSYVSFDGGASFEPAPLPVNVMFRMIFRP